MPLSQRQLDDTFGTFDFHDDPDRRGAIIITGDWILHNLARITPPFPVRDGAGKLYKLIACHELIADDLTAVLTELRDGGLTHLINTFDGCWCARHKCWDPARGLSSHSWGIAVDVNARRFPYGSKDKQDARLIAAFARRGFEWGGAWSTPDPMHFEFIGRPSSVILSEAKDPAVRVIVNDVPACAGRLIDGQAWAPVRPIAEALGAAVTYHPEQGKVYVYARPPDGR